MVCRSLPWCAIYLLAGGGAMNPPISSDLSSVLDKIRRLN